SERRRERRGLVREIPGRDRETQRMAGLDHGRGGEDLDVELDGRPGREGRLRVLRVRVPGLDEVAALVDGAVDDDRPARRRRVRAAGYFLSATHWRAPR